MKTKKKSAAPAGVEAEILKVTGAKPRSSKESDQDYRERLARSVDDWCKRDKATSEQADEHFDSLTEAAQEWCNEAAQATNDKTDIPDFPGAEGTSPPADTPEPETGDGEKPMKKSKKGSKGEAPTSEPTTDEKPKKAKKVKEPKEPKVKKPRGGKHKIFRKRVGDAYIKLGGKVKFTPVYDSYIEKVGVYVEDSPEGGISRPSASVVFSNSNQMLDILVANPDMIRALLALAESGKS